MRAAETGADGRALSATDRRLRDGVRASREVDPWFPAVGQPFVVAQEDFDRFSSGRIVVAEP